LAAKEYSTAELFYIKFLKHTKTNLEWSQTEILDAKICLAQAYSAQAKSIAVRELLEPYTENQDTPLPQKLQIYYELASVCWKDLDYKAATMYAKAAFRGRKKLLDKSDPKFQESASLLIRILQDHGEVDEAEVYRHLSNISSAPSLDKRDMPSAPPSLSSVKATTPESWHKPLPSPEIPESFHPQKDTLKTPKALPVHNAQALSDAVRRGDTATVLALLQNGLNVETKVDNLTLLYTASREGNEAMVKILLDQRANVSAKANGRTALHGAAFYGHEAVCRLLLDYQANIKAKTDRGSTPLHNAAQNGHTTVVHLLLDKGADIEARTNENATPLYVAMLNGQTLAVHLLLERGANVEARWHTGASPLYTAAELGYDAIVKLLLERAANMEAWWYKGGTPLYIASYNGHEQVVRLLLQNGAKTETKTEENATPLYIAVKYVREAIVRLLLQYGASLEVQTINGNTVFTRANINRNQVIVKLLDDAYRARTARNYSMMQAQQPAPTKRSRFPFL
jgi:ankyrin repeat protein